MSNSGGNNESLMKEGNSSPNSFQNSQNPESSNNYANQPNNMNSYNSGSTYGSSNNGYNSGYGSSSYGSGYGSSYGGYGSSYGSSYGSGYGSNYGSGYGSSYGSGYGSGYSSGYGGPNQYSNTYSKPMQQGQHGQQGQQNQQAPPPDFRHDVWGFLNGFHAILNVMYAGTGIVHFGKMFFKMSIKIIKSVFGKSAGLVYKLTGFQFLKNIMQKFSSKRDWFGEFNIGEAPLENVWGNNGPESANSNKTFFGKFMLVLRILSLMGGIVAFFLRRKVSANHQQHPPVQIEFVDNEIPQIQLKPAENVVGIEGIKSFYDEVKLLEQDHAEELRDSVSMNEIIEEINEQVNSDSQTLDKEEKLEGANDENSQEKSESLVVDVEEKTLDKLNEDGNNQIAVISSTECLTAELPIQESLTHISQVPENHDFVKNVPETQVSSTKEQIVSEDFWKNEEVFKKIESIQKENSQQAESKRDTFELPSVLKTIRTGSSNATKPWMMKKKKNPEPAATEAPVQNVAEPIIVQTLPSEVITPDMPISEIKKENSEVVEISSAIENPIEGTA